MSRHPTIRLAAVAVVACVTAARGQQPATDPAAPPPAAEFRDGHWQSIEPVAPPTAAVPDPDLDHVQALLDHGDGEAALAVALKWVKGHGKTAPRRDRALYLTGLSLVRADDPIKAYYYFDELMDEYPSSPLFYPALDAQYHIADGLLNGHKLRVLGVPILPGDDEAVEMLFRIQQRSPGSPLAEAALLRTADFYYAGGDYDLAGDAYDFYVKQYPRSDRVAGARLRSAFADLARFRGPRFDATPMLDARTKLADFAAAYPRLAADENVPGILSKIDDELATSLYLRADFYRRTGATDGAVYMYRYQLLTYPNGPHAADARAALAQMPAWALAQPSPRPGQPYVPPAVPRTRVPTP